MVVNKMKNISAEHISSVIRAISNPERLAIIDILAGGRSNVTGIVKKTGIAQPKVSTYLSMLQNAGIVDSFRSGKEIIYSIVPEAMESLLSWAEDLSGKMNRSLHGEMNVIVPSSDSFSYARCCYDHLAGKIGVYLLEELLRRGWIAVENSDKPTFLLTNLGEDSLKNLGVNIPVKKKHGRIFAYGCRDVSERKLHLGGSLGHAIFQDMIVKGIIQRSPGTRSLRVNSTVDEWFSGKGT